MVDSTLVTILVIIIIGFLLRSWLFTAYMLAVTASSPPMASYPFNGVGQFDNEKS
jgi:hypothetical protein